MSVHVVDMTRIDLWRTLMHLVRINALVDQIASLAGLAHDDFQLQPRHYGTEYDDTPVVKVALNGLRRECEALDLGMTIMLIDDVLDIVSPDMEHSYRMNSLLSVTERLRDEVSTRTYFYMPQGLHELYQNRKPFGNRVWAVFQDAIHDTEEAAKCLALERATACVFHCMRVIELGIRSLISPWSGGVEFLVKRERRVWSEYVRRIRNEAQKDDTAIHSAWAGRQDRLNRIAEHLNVVAEASRNPTMHANQTYSLEEAHDVFGATGAFMRRLAHETATKDSHDEEAQDPRGRKDVRIIADDLNC